MDDWIDDWMTGWMDDVLIDHLRFSSQTLSVSDSYL